VCQLKLRSTCFSKMLPTASWNWSIRI